MDQISTLTLLGWMSSCNNLKPKTGGSEMLNRKKSAQAERGSLFSGQISLGASFYNSFFKLDIRPI